MDIASLKIKFTPFLKTIRKGNSKCCLEIIPEVSALQNLDKIEWRLKENFIEYIIPMTYKIILKKSRPKKVKSDVTNKTYHSCVDLLHTCPIPDIHLLSEDLKRIISDNHFPRKFGPDFGKPSVTAVISRKTSSCKNISDVEKTTIQDIYDIDDSNLLLVDNSSKINSQNYDTAVASTYYEERKVAEEETHATKKLENNIHTTKNIVDGGTEDTDISKSDRKIIAITSDENHKMFESKTTSNESTVRTKPICELSLSPICSINTYEEPLAAKYHQKNDCENAIPDKIRRITKYTNTLNGFNSHKRENVQPTYREVNQNVTRERVKRILPDVRIAQFIQRLQNEMVPLKIKFNEITNKCMNLRILNKNNMFPNPNAILYKCIADYDRQLTNYCKTKKSNRVVYSIVFDDSN